MNIKTVLLTTLITIPLTANACNPDRDEFTAFFNENIDSAQFEFTCANARGLTHDQCLDRLYNELWKVENLCLPQSIVDQWLEEVTVYNRHGQVQGWDLRKFNSAFVNATINQLQYDFANDL